MSLDVLGGFLPKPADLVPVTRWGRPGLERGDWVMKGGRNFLNYLLSGKFQPMYFSPANVDHPYRAGETFWVPRSTLRLPSGDSRSSQQMHWFMGLVGQRRYFPGD